MTAPGLRGLVRPQVPAEHGGSEVLPPYHLWRDQPGGADPAGAIEASAWVRTTCSSRSLAQRAPVYPTYLRGLSYSSCRRQAAPRSSRSCWITPAS